jgi:hypothetical protein
MSANGLQRRITNIVHWKAYLAAKRNRKVHVQIIEDNKIRCARVQSSVKLVGLPEERSSRASKPYVGPRVLVELNLAGRSGIVASSDVVTLGKNTVSQNYILVQMIFGV